MKLELKSRFQFHVGPDAEWIDFVGNGEKFNYMVVVQFSKDAGRFFALKDSAQFQKVYLIIISTKHLC